MIGSEQEAFLLQDEGEDHVMGVGRGWKKTSRFEFWFWWYSSRSSIAFACGFLTLVGLRLMPYESHKARKWRLNSLPLLCIMYGQRGYLMSCTLGYWFAQMTCQRS
jgi:hypothetical protein